MDVVTLGAALKGAKAYTDATIAPLLGGVHYRGSVNYFNNLPSNPSEGDAYTVKYSGTSGTNPDGTEYVWALDTEDNTYKWIGFSPDTYTKSEIDNLLSGKQNTIDSTHKISADNVDDSNTTNKFVTAADKTKLDRVIMDSTETQDYYMQDSTPSSPSEGDYWFSDEPIVSADVSAMTGYAKAQTASAIAATDTLNEAVGKLEKALDGKQATIDANNKLSSDLVDDSNATHKFATAAQLSQIETNKNNISKQQDTIAEGGNGYAIINGKRLYMTDTTPTDGRQGDKWIDGNTVKSYNRTDNMINPETVTYGYYINANGEIVQSGAATPERKLNLTEEYTITEAKYTLSGKNIEGNNTAVAFCWFDSTHTFLERTSLNVNFMSNYALTAEPVQDAVYMRINYTSADGKPMLNVGDTALPYEPYLQWE